MNIVPHGINAGYRLTVREFPSMVEITAKTTNHQLEAARSYNHGLKGPKKRIEEMEPELRQQKDEENRTRSIRRARQSIRWLVQSIEADHMVTLSYRENMQDIDRLKADYDYFRRLVQARYPDWKYVCVVEKQDRGAYHLHIAVKGHQDLNYLRYCWYKVLGCAGATGESVMGQIDITKPLGRYRNGTQYTFHQDKLAAYLTKYMHKAFEEAEHHSKRYWASRKNIPKPKVYRYWLGSVDTVDMIKDMWKIAERLGLDANRTIFQSHDQTLLYLSGLQDPQCTISHNGELWLTHQS